MAKLFIPTVGAELTLSQDWNFKVFEEYRNQSLLEFLEVKGVLGPQIPVTGKAGHHVNFMRDALLPAGVTLRVDRIYIRKNKTDFDSITFLLTGAKVPGRTEVRKGVAVGAGTREEFSYEQKIPARGVRFWVTLDDANNIHFE